MACAVRAGGTVARYVWDYAGRMHLVRYFWDAAAIDARAASLDEGARFPLSAPDRLVGLLAGYVATLSKPERLALVERLESIPPSSRMARLD